MYAQLGNNVFAGLIGFDTFTDARESSLPEHEIIDGKPRLQKTGDKLDEISFAVKYHANFCVPDDEFRKLEASRAAGEILPFLLGNGEVLGEFVIRRLEKTTDQTADDGTPIAITVSVSLVEYAEPDRLSIRKAAAKKKAFALVENDPKAVAAVLKDQNEKTKTTTAGRKIKVAAAAIAEKLKRAANDPAEAFRLMREIKKFVEAAKADAALIESVLTAALKTAAPTLEDAAKDVQNEADVMLQKIATGDFDAVKSANAAFQRVADDLKTAAAPVISLTVLKKSL